MTEEEAKTKWCPHAGEPRFSHQSEDCIGSQCMAWRWNENSQVSGPPMQTIDVPKGEAAKLPPAKPGSRWCARGDRYSHLITWELRQIDGYCGLAGKP